MTPQSPGVSTAGGGVYKLNDGKTTAYTYESFFARYDDDDDDDLRELLCQRRAKQEPRGEPVQRVQAQVQVRGVREELRHQQQPVQVESRVL